MVQDYKSIEEIEALKSDGWDVHIWTEDKVVIRQRVILS